MNSDEKRLGAGMIASVFLNGLLIIPITASVVSPRSQEATAAQAAQAPDFEPPPPPPDVIVLKVVSVPFKPPGAEPPAPPAPIVTV